MNACAVDRGTRHPLPSSLHSTKPSVKQTSIVLERLQLHVLQWHNVLLVVLQIGTKQMQIINSKDSNGKTVGSEQSQSVTHQGQLISYFL